jgi:hypothetical protein
MPDGSGSSSPALIWVASMICLSDPITSSSARIDFIAADEQRHDHVREHDDVAQWEDGIGTCLFRAV